MKIEVYIAVYETDFSFGGTVMNYSSKVTIRLVTVFISQQYLFKGPEMH